MSLYSNTDNIIEHNWHCPDAIFEQIGRGGSATVALQFSKLHAVTCDTPMLIIPLSGRKRLHAGGKSWECHQGQFMMMHFAVQVGIENVSNDGVSHRVSVIRFPWKTVAMARDLLVGQQSIRSQTSRELVGVGEVSSIAESLLAYLGDAGTLDIGLKNYRLLGHSACAISRRAGTVHHGE